MPSGNIKLRLFTSIVPVSLTAVLLSGCGAGSPDVYSADSIDGGISSSDIVMSEEFPSFEGDMYAEGAPGVANDAFTGPDASGRVSAGETTIVEEEQQIIRTGQMSLESENVDETFLEVKDVFVENEGIIIDSSLQTLYEQTQEGSVTGKVRPDKLDEVMQDMAGLATVTSQSATARDVTLESKDLEARVKAAETSVARLQALLEQSGDLDNLLRIEVELSQRQAVLDSLVGQKNYLDSQVAMSTLTVYMRSAVAEIVEPVKTSPGFFAGLERGWEEFKADASRWATYLGQSAPYLVFFGVPFLLVGFITYRVIRRLGRKKPITELPPPSSPHTGSTATSGDPVTTTEPSEK